ncbi:MAG: glutamate 5-kinase [Candidatus Gastranaerophilales bacterium]|nr:glutamate 5-kinase [Candidatus Gastranaerophilales bacterium]
MNEIKNAKRLVFKFGTNVLRNEDKEISLSRIYSFVEDIAKLHKQGKEIIIVTSGAVGLGAKKVGVDASDNIILKQACAAIGQGQLMSIYEHGFDKYSINTAQILLTESDFDQRIKYLNLSSVLNELLNLKVIPIINQNDTVSTEELEESIHNTIKVSFSDNDKLSALVASKLDADLLVILSDIDGLFDDNPKENPNAKLIHKVDKVDESIEKYGLNPSKGGRGGMKTKLEAAKVVTRSGGYVVIANGTVPQIIKKVFNEKEVGTLFLPSDQLSEKRRWIGYATNITGQIVVNKGAKKALLEQESSLLSIGIVDINGDFLKGDVISILDENNQEIARGIANYNCKDCKKIQGLHSDKILDTLGFKNYDAVITRDNIVIL